MYGPPPGGGGAAGSGFGEGRPKGPPQGAAQGAAPNPTPMGSRGGFGGTTENAILLFAEGNMAQWLPGLAANVGCGVRVQEGCFFQLFKKVRAQDSNRAPHPLQITAVAIEP